MKYLLTLCFLLSVFASTSFAQVTQEEMDDLLNSQQIQLENPIISNFLMIRQIQRRKRNHFQFRINRDDE